MAIVKKPSTTTVPTTETKKETTTPVKKEVKAPAKTTAPTTKASSTSKKETTEPAKKEVKAPAKKEVKAPKATAPAKKEIVIDETVMKKDIFIKLLTDKINSAFEEKTNNPLTRNLNLVDVSTIFSCFEDIIKAEVIDNCRSMYLCGKQITRRAIAARTYPSLKEGAPETFKRPHYRMSWTFDIGEILRGTINEDGTFTTDSGEILSVEKENEDFGL